jgi:hypothetical protein
MPTLTRRCAIVSRLFPGRAAGACAWTVAFFLGASWARAHDPLEITTMVRVQPHAIVLDITSARSTALALAAGGKESPTFDPAAFAEFRPRLLATAPTLFKVSADGRALSPRTSDVTLSVEEDVEFHVAYPRPATGTLRLEATHLPGLGYGFGNVVTVALPGWEPKMLTANEAVLEIALPAAAAAPPAKDSSAANSAPASPPFRPWLAILSVAIVLAALLLFGRFKSQSAAPRDGP